MFFSKFRAEELIESVALRISVDIKSVYLVISEYRSADNEHPWTSLTSVVKYVTNVSKSVPSQWVAIQIKASGKMVLKFLFRRFR